MKRIICIILTAAVLSLLVSCVGSKWHSEDVKPVEIIDAQTDTAPSADNTRQSDISASNAVNTVNTATTAAETVNPESSTQNTGEPETVELLQSASIDLDGDGTNEQVEAVQATIGGQVGDSEKELEGRLKITCKNGTVVIPFIKKPQGLTGVMTGFEFKDLDNDGAKDIFVIIPDSGAAFSLNYFFIYNYKTGKSYSYTTDSSLAEFTDGFRFEYKGKGLLEIKNTGYGFSAIFDISKDPVLDPVDANNKAFDSSWVDPSPVEIGENSRLALVSAGNGITEIKVPLPVFGRATVDMIGEIDLYYRVDANFKPVLKRFEVIDFNDGKLDKIGEHIVLK